MTEELRHKLFKNKPTKVDPGFTEERVIGSEQETEEQARIFGLKKRFGLNYGNHRMSDISRNELICRLIFLIRFLKIDTVMCYDPCSGRWDMVASMTSRRSHCAAAGTEYPLLLPLNKKYVAGTQRKRFSTEKGVMPELLLGQLSRNDSAQHFPQL